MCRVSILLALSFAGLFIPGAFVGRDASLHAQQAVPTSAPVQYGETVFKFYCVSCHGPDARGGGPSARSLKIAPPDLRLITRRAGGVFPATLLTNLLTTGDRWWIASHGTKEMPVWGASRRHINTSGSPDTSLVAYLASIQQGR